MTGLLVIVLGLALALGSSAAQADPPLRVQVSIPPQAGLLEHLGGARVSVRAMVRAGQSPETFEPTSRQLAHLAQSRLYVRVGMPFEARVLAHLASTAPDVRVADMREGIELLPMEACRGHEHTHEHPVGASDPHFWLDPRRMKIAARRLADELARLDPEGRDHYEQRLAGVLARLDEIDARVEALLAPYRGRTFYVFHPAFGYFADTYGLAQAAVEQDGKEPGARALATLISRARADRASTLFVQPQFPQRSAETVARAIGARLEVLDDLPHDPLPNYLELAEKIAAALGAAGP